MTQIHQYDLKTMEYLGSRPAQMRPSGEPITDVIGGTAEALPVLPEGHAARWTGTAWEVVEDHRRRKDERDCVIEGSGTPYWLPGDTHETPARYMTELGPLPTGALLVQPTRPVPTKDELAASVRAERDRRLADCQWIVDRHADQLAVSSVTTLTDTQYKAWLIYRQELRDLPAMAGFPWAGGGNTDTSCPWPVTPEAI